MPLIKSNSKQAVKTEMAHGKSQKRRYADGGTVPPLDPTKVKGFNGAKRMSQGGMVEACLERHASKMLGKRRN